MSGVNTYAHTTLSIRISTDGFCFCSYTASEPDTLQYHSYEADSTITLAANFERAWEESPFHKNRSYDDVNVIMATNEFTTIPTEYDKKEEHRAIYNLCFPHTPASAYIASNHLTAQGITILFAIDNALHKKLCSISRVTYLCPASILLGFIARYPIEEERYMLAYFHKGKSLLLSVERDKPTLINSFKSDNPHDQTFYLLSIWKEQSLSQSEDTLYLCGDNSVEEVSTLLGRFIRQYKRINPNRLFRSNLLNRIKDIPFDLQALLLCE